MLLHRIALAAVLLPCVACQPEQHAATVEGPAVTLSAENPVAAFSVRPVDWPGLSTLVT